MNLKPQTHLVNIIRTTRDHHPNFVLFLGAGASSSSGVKVGYEMIKEWRNQHFKMYGDPKNTLDQHLAKYPWANTPDEYSILFEQLYDEPSQRREYIESCIINSKPSWGYIYLVNLLRNKVFNTVFTTNFDDLLNEACYLFSNEVRPIVCAHDSSITSVRITSQRPKIIKLHGDFLFDNIKNTVRELESLEKNTLDKFKQYASEFGFIFIGYSGNDRSVMDTLNMLLKFDNYFPHGIYWCIKKGQIPCEKLDLLSRFPKLRFIEISGFDEFFAELHSALDIQLQPEMADPYKALVNKLNNLIDNINLRKEDMHVVIDRDIKNLGYHISRFTNTSNNTAIEERDLDNLPVPYGLLSDIYEIEGNFDNAIAYRLKEINVNASSKAFTKAFKLMFLSNKLDLKEKLLEKFFNSKELFSNSPMETFDSALVFIEYKDFDIANKILDFGFELSKRFNSEFNMHYYVLNKFQIKSHKGEDFSEKEIETLYSITKNGSIYSKLGAYILLKDFENSELILKELAEKERIDYMASWPIISLLIPQIKDQALLNKLKK